MALAYIHLQTTIFSVVPTESFLPLEIKALSILNTHFNLCLVSYNILNTNFEVNLCTIDLYLALFSSNFGNNATLHSTYCEVRLSTYVWGEYMITKSHFRPFRISIYDFFEELVLFCIISNYIEVIFIDCRFGVFTNRPVD